MLFKNIIAKIFFLIVREKQQHLLHFLGTS